MNKTEFVKALAARTDLGQNGSATAVNAMIEIIGETLASGETVTIPGFGTFSTKHRAERAGKNPQTGEAITIPAARVPHFKAGSKLKDKVSVD